MGVKYHLCIVYDYFLIYSFNKDLFYCFLGPTTTQKGTIDNEEGNKYIIFVRKIKKSYDREGVSYTKKGKTIWVQGILGSLKKITWKT
jgi:hypothetical protein